MSELFPGLKAKTTQFNNGELKYNNNYVNFKQNDIIKFDTLDEKKFDEYKQFPILSNEQVHADKNIEAKEGQDLNITETLDKTMDSFSDDILGTTLLDDNQKKLNINDNELQLSSSGNEINLRPRNRKRLWPKILILLIIILIITFILIYFFVIRKSS